MLHSHESPVSYQNLSHSQLYYELRGYKSVEAPWLVAEEVSNITKPADRQNFHVNDQVLVASGEQSFLQMIHDIRLSPTTRYQAITPCFRDEEEDEQHHLYFLKNELIYYEHCQTDFAGAEEQLVRLKKEVDHMVNVVCLQFFSLYLPEQLMVVPMKAESLQDQYLFDIVAKVPNSGTSVSSKSIHIELGSYGIRKHGSYIWAFGTGCAEPRLSYAIQRINGIGYHVDAIPKTRDLGSVDKIVEEYQEFIDAVKQKTAVMALVELSDLVGAIDLYVHKHYNLRLEDLKYFSNITQRAFTSGQRPSR